MSAGRADEVPTERIAAFGYHEVTESPLQSGFLRQGAVQFTITPGDFERHLALATSLGVAPVLVTQLGEPARGRRALMTFDDGGKSALRAAEALARRGWRGHFFIITSRIGERTFLNAAEIRELRASGHIVGSHSDSHPDIFRDLPFARMIAEWRTSRERLADILGEGCTVAAVPGGHISPAVLRSADSAGIESLFTCDPTLVPEIVGHCRVFGRFLVKRATSQAQMAALLGYRGWGAALMVRRSKDLVRRAMPSLFRFYLGRRTREQSTLDGAASRGGMASQDCNGVATL